MTISSLLRRSALVAPLLFLSTQPAGAQQSAFRLSMTAGVDGGQPLTRTQLRSQLASKLRVQNPGRETVRARLIMIASTGGRPERVYLSQDFALAPGSDQPIPADALPGTDWLPEGAGGGAAFGWFPDWLNRLLGLGTKEEVDVGNSAADAYWMKEQERKKHASNDAMFGSGNSKLHSGPPPGPSVTTLSMIVLPVSGPDAATAPVQGVSIALGK